MTIASTFRADVLLAKLAEVLRAAPDDVHALCEIGAHLSRIGRLDDVRRCYRAAVAALKRAARANDVDRALDCEQKIYRTFVSTTEDEKHYYRCFADWKDDLVALGRRFRDPTPRAATGARRVAFFMHTGFNLGHTLVLLKLLAAWPRDGDEAIEARIYVFDGFDPALLAHCREIGVEVVLVRQEMSGARPPTRLQKLLWLRERFLADGIDVCVWVSLPTIAAFALSMRLAPVQIFWAMRFHPLSGSYIDGYITWGGADEKSRRYGKQDWEVVPLLLAVDDIRPAQAEKDELRARFPENVLLGTLAREDKINSAPFLQAVADVLKANPQAGFLWTGHSEHPGITGFFRNAGVAERCHFVGWVDTGLYAAALDVFLDTFPHGCGITSYQAFAANTPVLSYLGPSTIFGTHFWKRAGGGAEPARPATEPRLRAPDEHAILCARDAAEYVGLAGRLITDPDWRTEIGARGRSFFADELRSNEDYARRFFETVSRIVASTPLQIAS